MATLALEQSSDRGEVEVNIVWLQVHEAQHVGEQEWKLSKMLNVRETTLTSDDAKWLKSCILGASGES